MRHIMTTLVGVQRDESSLEGAEEALGGLLVAAPTAAWRTLNQLTVARLIARSARCRRESVGGHRRADYPPARRPEPV
jgi:aspartate oxidase